MDETKFSRRASLPSARFRRLLWLRENWRVLIIILVLLVIVPTCLWTDHWRRNELGNSPIEIRKAVLVTKVWSDVNETEPAGWHVTVRMNGQVRYPNGPAGTSLDAVQPGDEVNVRCRMGKSGAPFILDVTAIGDVLPKQAPESERLPVRR